MKFARGRDRPAGDHLLRGRVPRAHAAHHVAHQPAHAVQAGFGPFAPEIYRLPFAYPYRSADPERSAQVALEALERAFATIVDPRVRRGR